VTARVEENVVVGFRVHGFPAFATRR
jgi:hypothetical protein